MAGVTEYRTEAFTGSVRKIEHQPARYRWFWKVIDTTRGVYHPFEVAKGYCATRKAAIAMMDHVLESVAGATKRVQVR